jgi:lipoate-protein ligase A
VSAARTCRAPAAELIGGALALLDATLADGRVRARWSRATDPAVVLGSAQRFDGWHPPPPYALVRRGTGGGAVVCDERYLMLDVTLPPSDARVGRDVADSYRWLAELLCAELSAAGARGLRAVPPDELRELDRTTREAGRVACFAGLGSWEIVTADGRKLVGLAQRRRRGAALFQAAAYLEPGGPDLAALLPLEPAPAEAVRARLAAVATLAEVAPRFAQRLPSVA